MYVENNLQGHQHYKDEMFSFSKIIEGHKRSLNMTLKGLAFLSIAFALVIRSILSISIYQSFYNSFTMKVQRFFHIK